MKLITDKIDTVTKRGIVTKEGEKINADIIITATGLNMKLGGNVDMRVDGEVMPWSKRLVWNGSMIDGVPNMSFMFGYTNNTWTIGTDACAMLLPRVWNSMAQRGARSATPRAPSYMNHDTERLWTLNSTYSLKAQDRLPVTGKEGPWRARTSPPLDYVHARWGDCTSGLRFAT